jgi:hypothetical protein
MEELLAVSLLKQIASATCGTVIPATILSHTPVEFYISRQPDGWRGSAALPASVIKETSWQVIKLKRYVALLLSKPCYIDPENSRSFAYRCGELPDYTVLANKSKPSAIFESPHHPARHLTTQPIYIRMLKN